MKKIIITLLFVSSAIFCQQLKLEPKVILPTQTNWNTAANGIQTSILFGNPVEEGFYVMLYKIPDKLKLLPHYHQDNRTVIILEGNFFYGYGSNFDESKMYAMPKGTYFTEPANQHHFAYAKDGEVLLYVTGFGPSSTTFVEENKK